MIDDPVLAVFATLGVIGLLVLADFGGDLAQQARAYVLATVIAAALVALGTAVSEHTFAAAGLLFVVALCVSLSTVLGRNVATGANGVLLFFLVACAVPAPLEPWTPGCRVCCSAAASRCSRPLTIWPQRPRDRLRGALADAVDALARRIGQLSQGPDDGSRLVHRARRDALAWRGPSAWRSVSARRWPRSATTRSCVSAMA